VTADSHLGAPTQMNFMRIAAAAPIHTTASTTSRIVPRSVSRPRGVYAPADQQVDAGVVEPPHPRARAHAPGHPMVEGARTEHRHHRACEHRGCQRGARAVRIDHEQHADDEGDEERRFVQHAAQARLDLRRYRCARSLDHSGVPFGRAPLCLSAGRKWRLRQRELETGRRTAGRSVAHVDRYASCRRGGPLSSATGCTKTVEKTDLLAEIAASGNPRQ